MKIMNKQNVPEKNVPKKTNIAEKKFLKKRGIMRKNSMKNISHTNSQNPSSDNIVKEKKPFIPSEAEWVSKLENVADKKIILSTRKFKNEGNGKGFAFVGLDDWDHALQIIKTNSAIYEDYIKCKPYIDFEYKIPYGNYKLDIKKNDEEALDKLNLLYELLVEITNEMYPGSLVMIAKSHGYVLDKRYGECMKFSFHFVINGIYRYQNPMDAVQLAYKLKDKLYGYCGDDAIAKEIDFSVYNSEKGQKFRCIGSFKSETDRRVLEPINEHGAVIDMNSINIFDYLVSHSYDNDNLIFLPSLDQQLKQRIADEKANAKTKSKNERIRNQQNQQNQQEQDQDQYTDGFCIDGLNMDDCNDWITQEDESDKGMVVQNENTNDEDQEKSDQKTQTKTDQKILTADEKIQKENAKMIYEKLKKVIPSIRLEYMSYDNQDANDIDMPVDHKKEKQIFYRYNYNHSKHKCVHGCQHEKIGGYSYIHNDGGSWIYAGCYSNQCKTKGVILVGSILEKSYWEEYDKEIKETIKDKKIRTNGLVNIINEKYLLTSAVKKILDNYIEDNGCKGLAIASCIGSGKTTTLNYLLTCIFQKYGDGARILMLSTRRSFAQDVEHNILKNHKFINYMNFNGDLRGINRLIISLESLNHRLCNLDSYDSYDFIILDELETLLSVVHNATVKNPRQTLDNFKDLLKDSSKVVALDADMSTKGIAFMNEISQKNCIIKNVYKRPPKKYTIKNNYKKFLESIEKDIADGKKVCVATLSRDIGMDIRDSMKAKFPDIADKIMCLHSEASQQHKKELCDVNGNWPRYILLIFTTIVGTGVNFDVVNHFDKIYGYVVGDTESPRIFLQMLGRIRNPTYTDITIGISQRMNKNTNAQLYSLEYAENHYYSVIHKDYDGISKISKNERGWGHVEKESSKNIWNKLRAYHIQEKLNSKNYNFLTMLKIKIEENGDIFKTDFDFEPMKRIEIKKEIDRIIEAPSISDSEYGELKKCDDLTEEQKYTMKKVQMRHELSFKDTVKDEPLNECLIICHSGEEKIKNILNHYSKKEKKKTGDDYVDCKIENVDNVYNRVIGELKCEFIKKNKQKELIKEYDEEEFEAKLKNINISDCELNSLEINPKTKKKKYDIIKIILSKFGIILKAPSKQIYIDGQRKRVKTYTMWYDPNIYNIIYCKIHNNKDDYQDDFVNYIRNFIKYKCYIKEKQVIMTKKLF